MTFQRIALLSLCLLSACTPITPTPDAGPANTPPADPLSEELTRFQGQARTVEALAFDRGFPATVVAAIPLQGDSVLTRARDYLSRFGALYGQAEPLALEVRRFDPTEDDGFVTFHQTLSGVPVWGAELAVFVTGSELRAAVGRLLTSEAKVDLHPKLDGSQAITRARVLTNLSEAPVLGPATLVVFDPAFFDTHAPSVPALGWRLVLGSRLIVIDAHTGGLAFDLDQQTSAGDPAMKFSVCGWLPYVNNTSSCKNLGNEAGMSDAGVNDPVAVNTQQYARAAWNWDFAQFNRSGPSGKGTRFSIQIHNGNIAPNQQHNAYVDPFGDLVFWDDFVALDVIAHEYTHLVMRNSSGLAYSQEPGAMNEGFADLFGNLVEGTDWEVAEDSGNGILRDMQNPQRFGDPDRYSQYKLLTNAYDNGGVHTNSGIFNRMHYLLAMGGTQNGLTVSGVGKDKVGALAFDVMTTMPWASTYAQARELYVSRAQSWADASKHGFVKADVCAVRVAFAAVEIGAPVDSDCDGVDDASDADDDKDGVKDEVDNCKGVKNPTQLDLDGDGQGDACDEDTDGDGVMNGLDNCKKPNADQADGNRDGIGDACQDLDSDGVPDFADNCVDDANPGQQDGDANGQGDACDPDFDGDGKFGLADNCPFTANADQADTDGDGLGDACDGCPGTFSPATAWTTGIPGLGIPPKPMQPDQDGDGLPDACDMTPLRGGQVKVGGRPFGAADLLPGTSGLSLELTFEAIDKPVLIPISHCAGRCPELGHDYLTELSFMNLPDDVGVTVLDFEGRPLGSGSHQGGVSTLRFVPQGGRSYQLAFRSQRVGVVGVSASSLAGTMVPVAPRAPCVGLADGAACLLVDSEVGLCGREACAPSRCGDGVVDRAAGEECDDTNSVTGDGCEATCRFSCTSAAACDDGNPCNGVESCGTSHRCVAGTIPVASLACVQPSGAAGLCRNGACASAACGNGTVEGSEVCDDANLVDGDGCDNDCTFSCSSAAECDDANVCNGRETCNVTAHACVAGTALVCNDGNACTLDRCAAGAGCQASLIDADGDGFSPASLGTCGSDCDDTRANVNPRALEVCDGLDNNCNGSVDEGTLLTCYRDSDGDGYGERGVTATGCTCPAGFVLGAPTRLFDCFDGTAPGTPGAQAFPGQTSSFTAGYCPLTTCSAAQLSFDFDCDNLATAQSTVVGGTCTLSRGTCTGGGWLRTAPACGVAGTWRTCSLNFAGSCATADSARTQACK